MSRSLKSLFNRLSVTATAVGLLAAVALLSVTAMIDVVVRELSTSIESVRVANEVQVQLLLYHEAQISPVRAATRAALLSAVDESTRLVQSAQEHHDVEQLKQAVDAYLESRGDAELAAAFGAAHRLRLTNVEQAHRQRQRALVLEKSAKIMGTAAAVVLLLGLAGVLLWFRRGPLRQISAVSDTMERFRGGDLDARAQESGPRELVGIARTFNATAGALVRARQRQAEYVATAIHDLRTPLSVIQLALGYVTPGRPLPPEQRIRELMDLIGKQLTRLNGLIGDVLSATWIETGELKLLHDPLDLRAIASTSVELFRRLAPEHRIDMTMPSEPLLLHGDRARLEQVLNNLLSNAVKYSPLGSRVRVDLARRAEELALEVSDEGPGVAPEDRERIFETLQRHSATHEQAPGTSLGLWVSRRLVEAHGGRIELESRLGHGSTFRVILPGDPLAAAYTATEGSGHPEGPWA